MTFKLSVESTAQVALKFNWNKSYMQWQTNFWIRKKSMSKWAKCFEKKHELKIIRYSYLFQCNVSTAKYR
jgi:hypothetical protein